MADNRSEKPTPRRRQRARQEGQIARSRELPAALVLLVGVLMLSNLAPIWITGWRSFFERVLAQSASTEFSTNCPLIGWTLITAIKSGAPLLLGAAATVLLTNIGQAGFVVAPKALAPNFGRLSPAKNLKNLFSLQAISRVGKALVPASAIAYLFASMLSRDWTQLIQMGRSSINALPWIGSRLFELSWKSGLILVAWSALDYFIQRQSVENSLKMTKEELRREMKEEGPSREIKTRMRRMARKMSRKKMLQEVPKATVIVTNPTHFAIALRYEPQTMAAPVLIAKGLDHVAEEIKKVARWHNIPMVENVPLAHALYRSVEIGQTIPAKLYQVVAEILAFIYQAQAKVAAEQRRKNQRNKGRKS